MNYLLTLPTDLVEVMIAPKVIEIRQIEIQKLKYNKLVLKLKNIFNTMESISFVNRNNKRTFLIYMFNNDM